MMFHHHMLMKYWLDLAWKGVRGYAIPKSLEAR